MSFKVVTEFEKEIAEFFGAPYAVATDCCTHGVELCLRLKEVKSINVPKRTYLSIPMLANKLNIDLVWTNQEWTNWYNLGNNVIDAAILWKRNSYIGGTMMSVSFQYRKHLSLGRGGMILLDNEDDAILLKKMSYDGRLPDIPWAKQNVDIMGYHYYMTPETAQLGLDKLPNAIEMLPNQWVSTDWPDLTRMDIFKK